jgi:IMP cyclohydrolase
VLENDEVSQSRKGNKKLQNKLFKMDQEKNNLELNVMSLTPSNRDAYSAIVNAKNVYLKLIPSEDQSTVVRS